jgi:hypothetical protein
MLCTQQPLLISDFRSCDIFNKMTKASIYFICAAIAKRADTAKAFVIDDKNDLYVAVGSYSDACRAPGAIVGIPGCPLRDSVGGVWKFKADKPIKHMLTV